MNDSINIEKIMKKAYNFGINPQIINILINSKIDINKKHFKKVQSIIQASLQIEKDSQLSNQ